MRGAENVGPPLDKGDSGHGRYVHWVSVSTPTGRQWVMERDSSYHSGISVRRTIGKFKIFNNERYRRGTTYQKTIIPISALAAGSVLALAIIMLIQQWIASH